MLVEQYPSNGEEKPFGYHSVVEMLQKQLREEAGRDWELKCIPRAYVRVMKPKVEGENGVDEVATKHTLPTLALPVPIDITKKPLFPETYFSMFAEQDIQVCWNFHIPLRTLLTSPRLCLT
jgi:nuclear cap-binding protein subunit 1